jgi:hypothetical protein
MQTCCVLALAVAAAALAQSPAREGASRLASIEGHVISAADDRPLNDATLRVLSSEGPGAKVRQTKSDATGRYAMGDLPPGAYFIHVERSGYFRPELRANPGALIGGGIRVEVAAGERRTGIDIMMRPGAIIRGTVRDQRGSPVAKATVGLLSADRLTLAAVVWSTSSNATGEYVFDRVPPGSYYVQARAVAPRESGSSHHAAFYPGVPDERQAVAIMAGIGDVMTGIDIMVSDAIGRGIEGVITSFADGAPELRVLSTRPNRVLTGKPSSEGAFKFGRLDNGRYLVTAVATTSFATMAAWQVVEVVDNVVAVQLLLEPTGSVNGKLVAAPGAYISFVGMRVGAALADGDTDVEPLMGAQGEVAADGTFAIDGLYGARIFRVVGLPFGCGVTDVSRDGRSIATPHATLSGASVLAGFQITVSCN